MNEHELFYDSTTGHMFTSTAAIIHKVIKDMFYDGDWRNLLLVNLIEEFQRRLELPMIPEDKLNDYGLEFGRPLGVNCQFVLTEDGKPCKVIHYISM